MGGHFSSSHSWLRHDLGVTPDGRHREDYAKHYPQGFNVVGVEDVEGHAGLKDAFAKNAALPSEAEASR